MGGPKNRTRNMVAAVLLLVLIATDLFPLMLVPVGASNPGNVPGRDLGPRAGPNFNDPKTNSIGTPAYFASLSNILGFGTPSGDSNDLLSLDLDGDGSLELATITGQGFVEVLDPPTYKLLWRSSQFNGGVHAIAQGDIDGDGFPDLLASDGYGWVYVFSRQNLEDPTAPSMTSARIDPVDTVRTLTVVDFDDDGRSDILCGGMSDFNITYLRNTLAKDGTTVVLAQNKSRTLSNQVEKLFVADCYGNGDQEVLVVISDGYNQIQLMIYNRTTLYQQFNYGTTGTFVDLEVADLDSNGVNEVILIAYGGVTVLNATNLNYRFSIYDQHERFKGSAVGDFNGDGRIELLLLGYYYEARTTYLELYNGSGLRTIKQFLGEEYYNVGLVSGDLDNDNGLPEIALTSISTLTIMEPDLAQGYNFTITSITSSVGYRALGLGYLDWDGDGTTELISGSDEGLLSVLDPTTGDIKAQRNMAPNSQGNVIVADTDMDGEPEIVSGNLQNITILNKNLTTQAHAYIGYWGQDWTPSVPAPLAVCDVDHDGLLEIVVGTEDSRLFVLNGGNLSIEQSYSGNNGKIRALIGADITGDGFPEIITGDTLGHITIVEGPALHTFVDKFYDFGPYGLSVIDQGPGKHAKLLVGNSNGVVRVLGLPDLDILNLSKDLGQEVWGLVQADVDGDGGEEVLAGTGDGKLYALDPTDLSVKWVVTLGEWIGTHNCILVKDLDTDGKIEVAVGSDGYVYVLRMFTSSQKPDISLGAIPLMLNREDGQVLEFSVPVTISGPVSDLKVTVDFWVEPTGANVTGGQFLGRVYATHGPGTFTASINWSAVAGDWKISIEADPDDHYSETDKLNNRATLDLKVLEKYAHLEWFAGQGTVLGRYQGMVISDTDQDSIPELLVSASEGYVQAYHAGQGHNKNVSAFAMSDDLGSNPFGMVASDVDRDGDTEVVVSNGEGIVYAFEGIGERMEWKSKVTDGPCYGLVADDLDSDGKVEIITGCHDSQLYILNGQDGTLKTHAGLLFELYALDIADFGEDGKLDLIAAAQDGTVSILNAATLHTQASFKLGDAQIDDIEAGDIDHDGRNELIYGDRSGKVYVVGSVHNATSQLGWNLLFKANISTGSAVKAVQLVDLSKDTGLELLVASEDGVSAYRSRLGQFEILGNMSVTDSITGMACGDVDKDGTPELVVGTLRGNLTLMGLNATYQGATTTLKFTVQTSLPGLGTGLYGTAYGDLDGDGAPELLLGTESGELRVYDGISKVLKLHQGSMGSSLYGLEVVDVDGDGSSELVTGSGDKQVRIYDYQEGALVKLWSSDKLGDWTIAFEVLDVDLDGKKEVLVGAASKVYILNGTTGRIMNSTFDLGSHIISLATGELDGDPWPELVVGTEEGYMPVLNGNNLTLAWGAMLDSWPVGLSVADSDGDGIATIYAGTNTAVYALSFKDRETLWKVVLGQSVWGLVAADFQSKGEYELFLGLKDGRTMALNVTTGRMIWSSNYLGSRAGWYNSLKIGDTDNDGQKELMIGSSGFLYLFGAGYVKSAPVPDAVLRSVSLQDLALADGQDTNITAVVYVHSMAPMVNLTVHLFVDEVFSDSTIIPYLAPLETQTLSFPYSAHAGNHNLTVVLDRYNVIHEYNEANNENTLRVIVLGAMNLGIDGGVKGVRFSDPPIKGVEMTVYADIKNSGEEASGARIKFYWANLRLFGEDTVYVRGQQTVVAAVNWTPPEAGDQDLTIVIEPDGFDSNKDDNVATRTVQVMTHPSVGLGPRQLSTEMVEGLEYQIPFNITNTGQAQTTGSVAMFLDGNRSWGSGLLIIPAGRSQVLVRFNTTAGWHDIKVVLENLVLDDRLDDNELILNVTVRTRPDLSFDPVAGPKEGQLVLGKTVFIALLIANRGGSNATCTVRASDNDVIIYEKTLEVPTGTTKTLQVPWKVTSGDHNLVFSIERTAPAELNTNNNQEHLSLYVPQRSSGSENLWPQISIMVIVVLAPVVAALFYYAKVQPVRDAAKAAKEARQRQAMAKKPIKKIKKGV